MPEFSLKKFIVGALVCGVALTQTATQPNHVIIGN